MTTPVYPEDLPGVAAFQFTPTSQLVGTELDRAAKATHRFTQVPGALASVTWAFNGEEYIRFMDWWRDELLDGHRWFKLILPSAAGFKYTVVRFLQHRETQTRGYRYWIVTASIEILKRNIRPEIFELYITSTLYPILAMDQLRPALILLHSQLSPPIIVPEELQPTLNLISGSLNDILLDTDVDDSLIPSLTVTGGVMDDILFTGYADDAVSQTFTLLGGSLNTVLITNEIPAESITPTITILSGSLS
jgi:hypothetical protein